MVTSGQLLNPLLETNEESAPNWNVLWPLIDVADILWSFLSLSDSDEAGSEFSSHFTGLPCPLSVLLNAFTFAQSTHAPLTPLSHSPADEEVEDDDVEDEDDENNEDEKKEEGVDADCNCNFKH